MKFCTIACLCLVCATRSGNLSAEQFFTNIEETGNTVAIDVRTHKVVERWNTGSNELQVGAGQRSRLSLRRVWRSCCERRHRPQREND